MRCAIAPRWKIALTAAETGHLVLSTLHTIDAGQTIGRILGMFDLDEGKQIRARLSDTMRYVVSQRLVPRTDGGRQLILEILGHNLRTREAILLGEEEGRTFYEIIESNETFGWVTFDKSVLSAYKAELITEDTANLYATKKGVIARQIDLIKKSRGDALEQTSGLRLDSISSARR